MKYRIHFSFYTDNLLLWGTIDLNIDVKGMNQNGTRNMVMKMDNIHLDVVHNTQSD